MTRVHIHPEDGRLLSFVAVPPEFDDGRGGATKTDWDSLFEEAGLTVSEFRLATTGGLPFTYADEVRTWEGTMPGASEIPLQVDAAAYRG